MSVLPEPATPVFAVCPFSNLFLFVSEQSTFLCRRSGQLVWTARRAVSSPVRQIVWSPDQQYFAFVYESGEYTVHTMTSGRVAPEFVPAQTAVSCVAWSPSTPDQTAAGADSIARRPVIDRAPTITADKQKALSKPAVSALGTRDGRVLLTLCRSLVLPPLVVSEEPVSFVYTDEAGGELAVLAGRTLRVFSVPPPQPRGRTTSSHLLFPKLPNAPFRNARELVGPLVRSEELLDRLVEGWNLVRGKCTDYFALNERFFEALRIDSEPAPEAQLTVAMLTGRNSQAMLSWMQQQHEQGFIRWYKQAQSRLEEAQLKLRVDLISLAEELLLRFRTVNAPTKSLSKLLEVAYQFVRALGAATQDFEVIAPFIQYLFVQETDRPIAVTRLANTDLALCVDTIGASFFGDADLYRYLESVDDFLQNARNDFATVLSREGTGLLALYKPLWDYTFSDDVRMLRRISAGQYAAILVSNSLNVVIEGTQKRSHQIQEGSAFLGLRDAYVFPDPESRTVTIQDGEHDHILQLGFEPSGVAARMENSTAIVCVLSADGTRFEVFEHSL